MNTLNIPLYVDVFFAVAALTGLLLRPILRHWSDPIWVVILQCAFSLTTVFYSYYFWGTPRGAYCLIVMGLHASFIAGSLVFNRLIPPTSAPDPSDLDMSSRFLRTFLALSVAVLVCVLIVRLKAGLFIFADDPEVAKTLAKRSGEGYLYRITLGLSITTPATLVTLALMKKQVGTVWKWGGWLLPLFLTVTTGFKADLLFTYAAVFYAAFYVLGQSAERKIEFKYSALTLLAILAVFAATIGRRYTAVPVGPGFSKVDFTVAAFIGRFVLNGAGLNHYLSQAIKSFADLSPAAFVHDNLLVPFLAPLGLMRYPLTLGGRLGLSMTGTDVFGPNPTMYMEGLVYFGTIGAFFYCFVISALLFVHRIAYYAITHGYRSNFGVAIIVSSYFAAIALTTTVDFTLWMAGVTTFAFFVLPLLLAAMLISRLKPTSPPPPSL